VIRITDLRHATELIEEFVGGEARGKAGRALDFLYMYYF
jgi:hypothetical protein